MIFMVRAMASAAADAVPGLAVLRCAISRSRHSVRAVFCFGFGTASSGRQ
jgi:hypothetical protein